MSNQVIYNPLIFVDLNEDETITVKEMFEPYVPEKVNILFNRWTIAHIGNSYYARRETWDWGGIQTDTLEELANEVESYYAGAYFE